MASGNFFVGSISIFYWKGASHSIKRRSSNCNWRSLISMSAVSGIYSAVLAAEAIIMLAVTKLHEKMMVDIIRDGGGVGGHGPWSASFLLLRVLHTCNSLANSSTDGHSVS